MLRRLDRAEYARSYRIRHIQTDSEAMQLSVRGKQLDVGDALRTHVSDSLSKILGKYFGDAIDVDVTLSKAAHLFKVVVSAHVGRGIHMEAQGEADAPYAAFDMAADRLSTRLRRHKRRLRDHHKMTDNVAPGFEAQSYILAADAEGSGTSAGQDAETGPDGDPDGDPVIIAEMTTEIPSLTVGEAVMRMDLADLPAFMFRNSAHSGLNMVYRRPDGNIGWIDPRGNRGA